jgi:hypothetical protein
MARLKFALAAILVILVVFFALVLSSVTQRFLFTRDLIMTAFEGNGESYYTPTYQFNMSDSNNYLGFFYFRMEYIPPNQSSNSVYISIEHLENTKLDSIVFRFSSEQVGAVYLDTSDPVDVSYSSSRDIDSFTTRAEFGELGTLQGDLVFQFILQDVPYKNNNLFFTADITMHYMTPLQLTALKAQVSISTTIPQA